MGNLTRKHKYNEKKTRSVSAAVDITDDMLNAAEAYTLFQLPPRSLVTAAHIIRHVAANAITADIGVAGGSELFNDAALNATGVLTTNTTTVTGNAETAAVGKTLYYDTGADITITPSGNMTAGRFSVIVEYVEMTLGNGKLTDYVD